MFRQNVLAGKVVLITGGASGIGLGISKFLGQHQAQIAICSRNAERLNSAKSSLSSLGIRCEVCVCDVRKPQEVEQMVKFFVKTFGKVDILINCAAGNFLLPFSRMSLNAFRTVHEIDTFGTFNVTKSVFTEWMKEHGGAIVNISATVHYSGWVMQVHAGSAKAAIDAMTKHLSVELGPYGITVNGVAPGIIGGTEGVERLAPKGTDVVGQYVPVNRIGTPEDIAAACLFLCQSSYITGQTVTVDGGWHNVAGNPPLLDEQVRKAWRAKL